MMRRVIIAANWKLNKTIREAVDFAEALKRDLGVSSGGREIVICPPFTALERTARALAGSKLQLGAQDLYWEESGAFTGEVSAPLLKDAGCAYVIVGHSERRQFFAETDAGVNRKAAAALKHGLVPIICCGELLGEREAGKTFDVLRAHIEGAFRGIPGPDALRTAIAYEPVWAIGTGKVATPAQAQEAHAFIRGLLAGIYPGDIASRISILYGGSVKPDNAGDILRQPDVDGALVGGASLEPGSFAAIVNSSGRVRV